MLGKAMDFYIPGVSLKKLRDTGLQDAGRRRRLLSALGFALRPSRRRQCPPLAAHEPQGTGGRVPERQDAACAERRQAAARLRDGARLLRVAQEERHHGAGACRPARRNRAGPAGCSPRSSAAAPTRRRTTARAQQSRRQRLRPPRPRSLPASIRIVPPELANPASAACLSTEAVDETPETIIAALPARDIPLPVFAPRPQVDVGSVDVGRNGRGRRHARQHSVRHGRGPAGGRRGGDRRGGRRRHSAADMASG